MSRFIYMVIPLVVFMFMQVDVAVGQSGQCNMTTAVRCVRSMEAAIGRVVQGVSAGLQPQESLQHLCLDVIKGNNLTQCYIEATAGCAGVPSPASSTIDAMKDWERVMQDLYNLCDGACPNFLQRTINITQCTSLIRFDQLHDNSYLQFCTSLNASLQCSRQVSAECPVFSQLFYDLLPRGIDQTADTICTADCQHFDTALGKLEQCKTYVADLPDDLDDACKAYEDFTSCLHSSQVPVTCPMFGALMEVLYPQHIFGLYKEQCNLTDTDRCGPRGRARLDHCLRIFSLAWPITLDSSDLTERHCGDFQSALRCLDNSGYKECPGLRQYFANSTVTRRQHRELLEHKCASGTGDGDVESSAGHVVLEINVPFIYYGHIETYLPERQPKVTRSDLHSQPLSSPFGVNTFIRELSQKM